MVKKILILAVIAAAAGIGFWAYCGQEDAEVKRAHGFVDVKESALGFERSGRIEKLLADEGQEVTEGEKLAVLDGQALKHERLIKDAQCRALKAQYEELKTGYRSEEIARAAAQAESLKHTLDLAQRSCLRTEALYKKKAVSLQERDQACLTAKAYEQDLKAAEQYYAMLSTGYRTEQIEAAFESFKVCLEEASYLEYQSTVQSMVTAPYAGRIRSRVHEVGDYVSPAEPVFYLSKIDPKEVRVYLSEAQLTGILIGTKARVSAAGAVLEGKVAAISDTALFTPKTVQTEDLRADLVYEVKILVPDPEGKLRLGQAVTAEF